MTVSVESIDVVAQPIIMSAALADAPIDIDVTNPNPVIVDISATRLLADVGTDAPSIALAIAGAQGPPGQPGAGSSQMVLGEIPSGAVDGINTVYNTAAAFQLGGSALYLNGLRERFYTELTATTVQFDTAPLAGDLITIDYLLQ